MPLGSHTAGASRSLADNPVADEKYRGGVRNVAFYYQTFKPGTNFSRLLGSPSVVVTIPQANQQAVIKEIHTIGAKAYVYVQFYWAPNDRPYEGINLSEHPGWRFCLHGDTPVLGRTLRTSSGHIENWYFLDGNENPVRAAFGKALKELKAEGWDGVMFDRGQAATQFAFSANGSPVWKATSTCTQAPHKPGATFADAYVNMLGQARHVGLQVLVNNGISPFDPARPMRPDTKDAACRAHHWARCRFLSDEWSDVDLVLNETGTFPRAERWQDTFAGNQRSERNKKHGLRTVVIITTSSLGGNANQTPRHVFYAWARVKLFNLSVAVNTGTGGCPGADPAIPCNRHGLYPSLVNVRFGKPTSTGPTANRCANGSSNECVWSRQYANGVDLVNVTPHQQTGVRVNITGAACRYVYDVAEGKPLANNRCVHHVTLDLGPWTGHPVTFSASPHS